MAQARREALEQRVEGGRELRELVVRLAAVEAPVEVVITPAAASSVIRETGSSALPRIQWLSTRDGDEERDGERYRADERDRGGLVVGGERDAGDHRADALARRGSPEARTGGQTR